MCSPGAPSFRQRRQGKLLAEVTGLRRVVGSWRWFWGRGVGRAVKLSMMNLV